MAEALRGTGVLSICRDMVYEISEKYANLAWEVINENDRFGLIKECGVGIGFLASETEKKSRGRKVLGECIKVKDMYKPFVPHDFVIIIYEPNVAGLSGEQLKVLLYHELLHIGIDDSGIEPKYKIVPHDTEEFREIIEKFGIDWAGT